MKKLTGFVLGMLLMASCSGDKNQTVEDVIGTNDLTAIKAKRTELSEQMELLNQELKKLDIAINDLDTVAKLPLVTTTGIKDTLFHHYVALLGSVSTEKNLVINSEFPGTLLEVLVKRGQQVKKGQLLARVDDGGLASQLAQAEVQANLTKTTFDRQQRLWDQKIGSEIQYLQAKAQFESANSLVSQLREQLAKTRVTAPFSGTIDEIITDKGSVVGQGTPLFRVVDLEDMRIEVEVPETYITSVKKGTSVKAFFPVLNQEIMTRVEQVSNYINPANRSFKIQIHVPNESGTIKPNLNARVFINDYTNEKALLIPQSVITENAEGDQYVYLASTPDTKGEASANQTIIHTGKAEGDLIEVTDGLKPGDLLIVEGARNLREGQKVKILNAEVNE